MRKLVTVFFVSALLASIVVASASSALPKPKPWQWTPQKVALRLKAVKPINGGDVGSNILSASCTPTGRGVAGRYSRFTCTGGYGGSNGSYGMTLTIRVLPIGTGKLCVVGVTTSRYPGAVFAQHPTGKLGPPVNPGFACPSPSVVP